MLAKHAVRLFILVTVFGAGLPAAADVRMGQLSATDLEREIPGGASMGVMPGDVLLQNDMIRAVIFATRSESDPGRMGQCLLLPIDGTSKGEPVRFSPGPSGAWQDVEAGMVASVAVVRLQRKDERWNAELVYKLHDGSSWVDVSTVLRNTDTKEILEIPVVDEVYLPSGSQMQVAGPRTAYIDQPQKNTTMGVMALSKSLNVRETSNRQWSMGSISGDPEPKSFLSVGFRLFGRKKEENRSRFQPVDATRDWHRSLRNEEDWQRVVPGEERAIDRRLISSVSITEAKALVEAVADTKNPPVQLVPSTRTETPEVTAPLSKSKIVGHLRTSTNAAKPVETPTIDAKVEEAEEDFNPPAILDPTIQAIEDLPPPIDGE